MDTLTHKTYKTYSYLSRYARIPEYYDTLTQQQLLGLGTNLQLNAGGVTHTVKETDTLDSLALKYYNNPTYWWVIAYYNDIPDAFIKLSEHYKVLQIPNIANIQFGRLN